MALRQTIGWITVAEVEMAADAVSVAHRNDSPTITIVHDSADQSDELPAHFAPVVRHEHGTASEWTDAESGRLAWPIDAQSRRSTERPGGDRPNVRS